jgi:hypothetical protein
MPTTSNLVEPPVYIAPAVQDPPIESNIPLCTWYTFYEKFKGDNVKYEASLYGPLNMLLASIFLPERAFVIKPQARLGVGEDGGYASDGVEDNGAVLPKNPDDSYGSAVTSLYPRVLYLKLDLISNFQSYSVPRTSLSRNMAWVRKLEV